MAILLGVIQFASAAALVLTSRWWPQPWWAATLLVIGATLSAWAWSVFGWERLTMAISVRRTELVVAGPYRLFRHPMYSGLLIACCGLALNRPILWRWAILVVLVVVLDIKARLEERELMETFSDYRDYRQRTWRLLPPIY